MTHSQRKYKLYFILLIALGQRAIPASG